MPCISTPPEEHSPHSLLLRQSRVKETMEELRNSGDYIGDSVSLLAKYNDESPLRRKLKVKLSGNLNRAGKQDKKV